MQKFTYLNRRHAIRDRSSFPDRICSRRTHTFLSHSLFPPSPPPITPLTLSLSPSLSPSLFRSPDISDISRARINSRRGRARAVVNRELSLVRLTSKRESYVVSLSPIGRNKTADSISRRRRALFFKT